MTKNTDKVVLKILGLLLLVAAIMKGWQLLVEPVANKDIWSNRLFLIFTVEFELALGIWLISGLFKKAAWLVAVVCFSLFSVITLYKGLSGADSCGCFGAVTVNPWITLFVVDLPAVVGLLFSGAKEFCLVEVFRPWKLLCPLPKIKYAAGVFILGLAVVGVSGPLLLLNEPAKETAEYVVLEPENWVGKELPILEHIDIGDQLKNGKWLILFYHYDCPDCGKAMEELGQMAKDLEGNEDILQIAFVEVPPYGATMIDKNTNCVLGQLENSKEWFVTTPAVVLINNSSVLNCWEEMTPKFNDILMQTTVISNKVGLVCWGKNGNKRSERRWESKETFLVIKFNNTVFTNI